MSTDELSFNPAPDREPSVHAQDEALLRLAVFGAALLAIAARRNTYLEEPNSVFSQSVIREARGIASAVADEARRLRGERKL